MNENRWQYAKTDPKYAHYHEAMPVSCEKSRHDCGLKPFLCKMALWALVSVPHIWPMNQGQMPIQFPVPYHQAYNMGARNCFTILEERTLPYVLNLVRKGLFPRLPLWQLWWMSCTSVKPQLWQQEWCWIHWARNSITNVFHVYTNHCVKKPHSYST